MKLHMLQDNYILGGGGGGGGRGHRPASFPWHQNFLDVSRAFQKTALVANMCFNIHVINAKNNSKFSPEIFLHFDTLCS